MSASVCSIKKKFPSIHWECVVCVNLPPGMPGPGLSVPSAVQSPVRKSSFLSSGAGVGGPICACTATAVISSTQKISTASDVRFIDVSCKEVPGGQIIGESKQFVNKADKNLQTLIYKPFCRDVASNVSTCPELLGPGRLARRASARRWRDSSERTHPY